MEIRENWINLLHRAATGYQKDPDAADADRYHDLRCVHSTVRAGRAVGRQAVESAGPSSRGRAAPGVDCGDGDWSRGHCVVRLSLSESQGNAGALQSAPRGRHDGAVPLRQKSDAHRRFRVSVRPGFASGTRFHSWSSSHRLFILVNVWELKEIEEPELVKRFGDEYVEYRRRTPMFFPGLGRHRN